MNQLKGYLYHLKTDLSDNVHLADPAMPRAWVGYVIQFMHINIIAESASRRREATVSIELT